jgi:hypothetical protein
MIASRTAATSTRRYDAPSAAHHGRFDAPAAHAPRPGNTPVQRPSQYRAPSSRIDARYSAPAARRSGSE